MIGGSILGMYPGIGMGIAPADFGLGNYGMPLWPDRIATTNSNVTPAQVDPATINSAIEYLKRAEIAQIGLRRAAHYKAERDRKLLLLCG